MKNPLFIVILLIASFFRFYKLPDYMTFLGDEGRDVLIVYEILHGNFTLLGPTASVGGFFLGPIYYYFMVPFLWLFNYSPIGPAVMVAIFGIATTFLIYKIGKDFFGFPVGIISSFLFAISPLVVVYSRSSWNPNLMPFFSLLTLYLTFKAIKNDNYLLFILCGFLLGITIQLHYLALFLGVIVFVYILLSDIFLKRNIFSKFVKQNIFILFGFVIGLSPFLAFEFRHNFTNIVSIFNFIFQSGDTGGNSRFFETIYNVFFRLFGRLVTNFPSPEKIALGANPHMAVWYYATLILGAGSVGLLIVRSVREYKLNSLSFLKSSLVLIWLIVGVGLFGFYKKPIYDYYFGFMFALPFFLVGHFISSISNNRIGKVIGVLIFVSLALLNFSTLPFRQPANRQLFQVEEISKFVISKTGDKPFNFALITGGNSDHAYRYFFKLLNKDPLTIETFKNDPQRSTVTDQLLVVCEVSVCKPLGDASWEIAGFGRAEIAAEWKVSVVRVFKLFHYKQN